MNIKVCAILLLGLSLWIKTTGFALPVQSADSLSENTRTINGIDYYSARMIKGFGFKLSQYLEEKIDGRQETETWPSLYVNVSPSIALDFFNRTTIKKIMPVEKYNFSTFPINTIIHVQAQIKPFSGFQFFPFVEVSDTKHAYDSELGSTLHFEDGSREYKYGVQGLYISDKGVVFPESPKLNWLYYIDTSLPCVSQGQFMVSFSGLLNTTTYTGISEKKSNSVYTSDVKKRFDTDWLEYEIKTDMYYGLSRKMTVGLHSHMTFLKNELQNNLEEKIKTDEQQISEMTVGPQFYIQISDHIFNKFSGHYSIVHQNEDFNSTLGFSNKKTTPLWDGEYNLYWLFNEQNVSVNKMLANYNTFFGNRLSPGAFLLNFHFSRDSRWHKNKLFKIVESRDLFESYYPELKCSSLLFELAAFYGLSDFIEIGLSSQWSKEKSYKPEPGSSASAWFDKQTWQNLLNLNFANYTYDAGLENKYGWYSLSSFEKFENQLLLQPGMFKGFMSVAFFPDIKADDLFSYIDYYNPNLFDVAKPYVTNKKWTFSEELFIGLCKNIEFKQAGQYYFYSSDSRNYLDKDWEHEMTFSWQPFKSLRFQFTQKSLKYVNNWDSRFSFYVDPYSSAFRYEKNIYNKTIHTWIIRVTSLF